MHHASLKVNLYNVDSDCVNSGYLSFISTPDAADFVFAVDLSGRRARCMHFALDGNCAGQIPEIVIHQPIYPYFDIPIRFSSSLLYLDYRIICGRWR